MNMKPAFTNEQTHTPHGRDGRFRRSITLAAAALALLVAACESGTGPIVYSIPYGIYLREERTTTGSVEERRVRAIEIADSHNGAIYDTIATNSGAGWHVDSTAVTVLRFDQRGDGYLRTLEIRTIAGLPDTSLHYWYFFRHGDSLFHYTGDHLLGSNLGLVGSWVSDPADTAIAGRGYSMTFTADSVRITGRYSDAGIISGTFAYTAHGSTLTIADMPVDLGERFEAGPIWGLYLTSAATGGYVKVR